MATRIVALCAALMTLAACAGATEPARSAAEADLVADSTSSTTDGSVSDLAVVVCRSGDVHLDDPLVQVRVDGVHFLIEDQDGAWGVELHHESWAHGTSEGVELSDGATAFVSAIDPGNVVVACLPDERSSYFDAGVSTATLVIVDPDELYVPGDLPCGFGEQFRMRIEADDREDGAEVFRRVPGVQPTDELRTPNYPESPQRWPTVMVFRDGVAVARLMAPGTGDEWELLINACAGSGIAKNHPVA